MSKKKIYIAVIIFAFILNLCIIKFANFVEQDNVSLKMDISSSIPDTYQIFYSTDGNCVEEQSVKCDYKVANKSQIMEFIIPSNTNYLRIDYGSIPSSIVISKMYLEYKNKKIDFDFDLIGNSSNKNMISSIKYANGKLILKTESNDPFTLVDITNLHLTNIVYNEQQKAMLIKKIVICVIIDIFLFCLSIISSKLIILCNELYKNRKLILNLARNDFKTKYAGSYFGIIWAFVQPIITVLLYWFVFQIGFKSGFVNNYPFVLWLVLGLVPWFFFSDAFVSGSNSMIEYNYLVKKVVFPISILPIVKVISALFVHIFFLVFAFALFFIYGYFPNLYALQIVYYSFCILILVLGISYINAAIVVFFRDLNQFINIFLQIGMWMTPIVWNYIIVPENYRWILKLNPMYYIVEGYRDSLINKIWFWEHFNLTIYFWITTLGIVGIGAIIFKRLKVHFADVL